MQIMLFNQEIYINDHILWDLPPHFRLFTPLHPLSSDKDVKQSTCQTNFTLYPIASQK